MQAGRFGHLKLLSLSLNERSRLVSTENWIFEADLKKQLSSLCGWGLNKRKIRFFTLKKFMQWAKNCNKNMGKSLHTYMGNISGNVRALAEHHELFCQIQFRITI